MGLDIVVQRLNARRARPGRYIAKCPAHEDRTPSLAITSGRGGRVLVRCWSGCELSDVLSASGLTFKDLFSGSLPTRAELAAAERNRAIAEDRRQDRLREKRAYIDALRIGYNERAAFLKHVMAKVLTMSDDNPASATMTELLHDCFAEVRSFDRAITADPDDYLPYERPVSLGPTWMAR